MTFENLEKMSIRDIDLELERIETGQTNPLHKSDSNDVSDRIKKLARVLMQLGYLDDDPNDDTLLQVAKVLGIDTRSIEPKAKKVQKGDRPTAEMVQLAGKRAERKILLQHYQKNPDELAKTSIRQLNEDIGLD